MSIRMIAADLYRLIKEVDRLEKVLSEAPPDKQAALIPELRRLKAERDRLRDMLEGQKDAAPTPKPFKSPSMNRNT